MSLALWARHQGDAPALIAPTGDRTFAELNVAANRLVRALRARGVGVGDSVAIVAGNRAEFAEAVHACLRAGLRYTPVNWHLRPDEMAYVIDDCEARVVVGDHRFADRLADAVGRTSREQVRLAVGGPIDGFEPYDAALVGESGDDVDDPVLGSRMLYTSGTTGRPKGVVRSPNYSTGLEALTTAPAYRAGTGQRNLCTGPLHHGGPLGFSLTVPLAHGVGVVLMERFDAATALELIERHRITHTHMVPTMFHRLLRLPESVRAEADVSSLQYVLHGAAPCPVETKQAIIDWFGPVVWEYYAATEGAGASASTAQWLAKPGTVGRPPTPDRVRIIDEHGDPCPPGEAGSICFEQTPELAFEYFKDPDKTQRARRGDYITVGDIGYLDEDGDLFVTDRDAELIVRGRR
ncbi:MAG: AMP-binding protein [Actinomycetota bacterium]